jgi:hypothetical protein
MWMMAPHVNERILEDELPRTFPSECSVSAETYLLAKNFELKECQDACGILCSGEPRRCLLAVAAFKTPAASVDDFWLAERLRQIFDR